MEIWSLKFFNLKTWHPFWFDTVKEKFNQMKCD